MNVFRLVPLVVAVAACSAEQPDGANPQAAATQPGAGSGQPPPAAAVTGKTPMTAPPLDPYALLCTGTNAKGIPNDDTQFPGVRGLFFYSDQATKEGDTDKTTTLCVDPTQLGAMCISGVGADSNNGLEGGQYAHWGAGFGLQLAVTNDGGEVLEPFNATALGLAGFRLYLTGAAAGVAPIRVQIAMVDDPNIVDDSKNLQQNAFLEGVDEANDVKTDGLIEVKFADLALPSWTNVVDPKPAFDATRMHSVQFQVVTAPGMARPYSFCVADLEWFDANGATVAVPVPVVPDEDAAMAMPTATTTATATATAMPPATMPTATDMPPAMMPTAAEMPAAVPAATATAAP